MSFPLSAATVPGYEPSEVDGLMSRVGRQLQNPGSSLVTSAMLEVARFDRVPGGYQVRAVDEALSKLADSLQVIEVTLEIGNIGVAAARIRLDECLEEIRNLLSKGPKTAFPMTSHGYNRKKIVDLLGQISVKRGVLSAPDSFVLRTAPLGKASSGPSTGAVDDFLSLVIRASLIQRLLAQ